MQGTRTLRERLSTGSPDTRTEGEEETSYTVYGSMSVPEWSFLKRVTEVKAKGKQVIVKDLYSGKRKGLNICDIKPFIGDLKDTLCAATYNDITQFDK